MAKRLPEVANDLRLTAVAAGRCLKPPGYWRGRRGGCSRMLASVEETRAGEIAQRVAAAAHRRATAAPDGFEQRRPWAHSKSPVTEATRLHRRVGGHGSPGCTATRPVNALKQRDRLPKTMQSPQDRRMRLLDGESALPSSVAREAFDARQHRTRSDRQFPAYCPCLEPANTRIWSGAGPPQETGSPARSSGNIR